MRCLTLAESWLALGGRAECWGEVTLKFAERRAAALGVAIMDRPSDEGAVLLVDVYGQRERLSLAGWPGVARRVLVDDLGGAVPIGYDVVWNPNGYGDLQLYAQFSGEVIAGVDCVPIRRGLPQWVGGGGGAVSFGGGKLPFALRSALTLLPSTIAEPEGWSVGEYTPPGWRRAREDDTWTDLRHASWLIAAAGSTIWEAAAVGIPVVVVVIAENQSLIGKWTASHGAPVIDIRDRTDPADIAEALATHTEEARRLPRLQSGADAVARRLLRVAT
jgi:hypothetical protein